MKLNKGEKKTILGFMVYVLIMNDYINQIQLMNNYIN